LRGRGVQRKCQRSLAVYPKNPKRILDGSNNGFYRSGDRGLPGNSWETLTVQIVEECHLGPPRVTAMMVNPQEHRLVWAGVDLLP